MATLTSIHGGRRGERVAVLLNANARSVDDRVRREIVRFVPEQDVFFSRTLEDARVITRRVLDAGYTTLLTGGGDGTFVGYVNEVLAQGTAELPPARGTAVLKLRPQERRPPKFGVLRLGTGNSLAGLMGASARTAGVVEDILRARSGDVRATRHIHLLDAQGKLAPFAGLGIDAKILNDYEALKARLGHTPLAALGSGGAGYFFSISGRSIPSVMFQRRAPMVVITNEGAPAQQIAPDGRPVGQPIEQGEILYQGPARFAAAGTVPCYGFGFTIFPHALKAPERMHLRVTAMTAGQILRHLPAIWKGRTPRAGVLDFLAQKVRLEFDRPMPFQIGGDAEGYRDTVTFAVDPRPVELLDFKATA